MLKADVAGSASRHSQSRVVIHRLDTLALYYSRFVFHRLTKRYLIVLSALTQQYELEKRTCNLQVLFSRNLSMRGCDFAI